MPRSAATSAPSAVLSLSQHLLCFYTSRDRNSAPSSVKCNSPLRLHFTPSTVHRTSQRKMFVAASLSRHRSDSPSKHPKRRPERSVALTLQAVK